MGARGTTFGKLERERAKKAKAAAKRARRQERSQTPTEDTETQAEDTVSGDTQDPLSAAELLDLVEATHRKFEAGVIGLEEFEETKADLLARLPID